MVGLLLTRASQTAHQISCQIQANSRGDRGGAATTRARQTLVPFVTGQLQTATKRRTTRAITIQPANPLGLQMTEQSRT